MIEEGIKGSEELTVTEELTAMNVGSGMLPVFSTPSMIALMEKTCASSVEPLMEEGKTTVGVFIEVHHVSATAVGRHVTCESILSAVNGRKLKFTVKAYDEGGVIGDAIHERVIIDKESFMEKVKKK